MSLKSQNRPASLSEVTEDVELQSLSQTTCSPYPLEPLHQKTTQVGSAVNAPPAPAIPVTNFGPPTNKGHPNASSAPSPVQPESSQPEGLHTPLIDGSESAHPSSVLHPASSPSPFLNISGLLTTLMKPAHFPLLRSSPAAGTGSYGALPIAGGGESSYAGSSLSTSTTSAEHDGRDSDENEVTGGELLGEPGIKRRGKRKENANHTASAHDPDSEGNSFVAGFHGVDGAEDGGATVESDGEGEEDENDPMDNSPYPEVRASVPATDDLSLSINTPRMWTLSILFSLIGSATNLFFSLRYPSISITPVIALLLAHPLGKLWDQLFPEPDGSTWDEEKGKLGKLRLWLGQGRWNRKEHCCVYISSNVSFGFAFATDVIVEQTKFYKQDLGIWYQILLTLSTQILGYTFAGLTRQWLVYPGGMIWPGTLMSTAMFTTLHGEENKPANGWKISRWKFFIVVFIGAFTWYFVPGLLMPALSYFNVVTWFAPKSVVVANLFGVATGLGMFPLTFDWAQISYIGSPLMTPFWAAANVIAGLIIVIWVIAPVLYYTNVLYSGFMPILSSVVFDNTGNAYDVTRVLTADYKFDEVAYKQYSRLFMPITYVLSYGLQFAALTALVTHTFCWHGKDIWKQWGRVRREYNASRNARSTSNTTGTYAPIPETRSRTSVRRRRSSLEQEWDEQMDREDVHMRLMRRYEEAPTSWYLATFVVMTAVGMFVVEYYPIYLPWYGLLLALAVCTVFFIPIGIVMAITNQQSSLFLVCQLICGTVFPGLPVANMVFVTYGYITSTQGLKFASDLKLGHYMKIPPRLLFNVQMVATLVSSLTQIGVLNWMFRNITGICTPEAMHGFTCPIARVHFNGSILWGVIGPQRFFGTKELYRPLVWAFAIGAVAPPMLWAIWKWTGGRKGSWAWLRKVSLPVAFGSLSWIPPATGLNFSAWAIVCFIFNHYLRRRAAAWWGKYTMTLSAALDASLAFGLVVIFFGFVYPGWMDSFTWWGTEIYKGGCDWQACSWLDPKSEKGGKFGPRIW